MHNQLLIFVFDFLKWGHINSVRQCSAKLLFCPAGRAKLNLPCQMAGQIVFMPISTPSVRLLKKTQLECVKEISLKIGLSTSIGNDCDYENEPQPRGLNIKQVFYIC